MCVLDANLEDWERALAWVRSRYAPLRFWTGGAAAELPPRAADIFPLWSGEATPLLAFDVVVGATVTCHFFVADTIEFSLGPEDVAGQPQLDALVEFLRGLARVVGKPALLTPENQPQFPILRADQKSGIVAHLPPSPPAV